MTSPILVGDIGGTHCRLALASIDASRLVRLIRQGNFKNSDFPGLAGIIRRFLGEAQTPQRVCLAVAGPTDGRRVSFTNLDWQIDCDDLKAEFGFQATSLVNDFLAVGHGLDALAPADIAPLQGGTPPPQAARLAVGAGTGLGVVQSLWMGTRYQAFSSEGGHIAFAPANDEQISLLRFLQGELGRVSVERLLSGPGIAALYRFCRAASGRPIKRAREPAEVTAAALAATDPTAVWAMKLFARIYGQTAGDLALIAQARGGVYLAGGIPPKILPLLQSEEFMAGFRDKGRFSAWMESVPVQVVLDKDIGLKGAALAGVVASG
jgi:glucokinase